MRERAERAAKLDSVRERLNALETAFRRRRWAGSEVAFDGWLMIRFVASGAEEEAGAPLPAFLLRSANRPSSFPTHHAACSNEQRTSHEAHQLSLGVFSLLAALAAGQPLGQALSFLRSGDAAADPVVQAALAAVSGPCGGPQ